jgi:hypothetical protein
MRASSSDSAMPQGTETAGSSIVKASRISMAHFVRPNGRTERPAAWHRPPTIAEAPQVGARRLPDLDWNAPCHTSYSALLAGSAL